MWEGKRRGEKCVYVYVCWCMCVRTYVRVYVLDSDEWWSATRTHRSVALSRKVRLNCTPFGNSRLFSVFFFLLSRRQSVHPWLLVSHPPRVYMYITVRKEVAKWRVTRASSVLSAIWIRHFEGRDLAKIYSLHVFSLWVYDLSISCIRVVHDRNHKTNAVLGIKVVLRWQLTPFLIGWSEFRFYLAERSIPFSMFPSFLLSVSPFAFLSVFLYVCPYLFLYLSPLSLCLSPSCAHICYSFTRHDLRARTHPTMRTFRSRRYNSRFDAWDT